MTVANITPPMMARQLELAVENDTRSGRADAIVHVSWCAEGDPRWEQMEEIQTANLDPTLSSRAYINGYTAMWAELYGLLF